MHICIDGRSVSHPRRGGYKTYIEGLLLAFHQSQTANSFTLCYDRDYAQESISNDSRFDELIVASPSMYLGQVYREHISLPLRDKKIKPALWHFPYNTAPVSGISDYILTLHDITSYTHSVNFDWSKPSQALQEVAYYYYPRLLLKRSAKRAKLVITVSNYAKDCIVDTLGIPREKVVVTPLAAHGLFRPFSDEEKAKARAYISRRFGLNRPFVLTVASSLLKNPQGSMAAFARLPDRLRHDCDLVIVMAYERFQETVRKEAEDLDIVENTNVLIDVDRSDLLNLYNLAELLLYPSYTESFSFPTVEAMACGTPIICSNNTVFPEQVGDAAILVDPADTAVMAEQLERLLSDRALAGEMRQQGLQRSKKFSWEKTAKLTLEAYAIAEQL